MKQFKRSFWQLLFFLTLALSLITFVFIKRPKFQSSLVVTTARVWGYVPPIADGKLVGFQNDPAVKGVFGILNKLFIDSAVSPLIHQFLFNKVNLAKSKFRKIFFYTNKSGRRVRRNFLISNNARDDGLWSAEGEQALMNPDFKLSSLLKAQERQNWLLNLRHLVVYTAVFDSDYSKDPKVQGAFNLQKTRTNIHNLFMGWTVEEMKVQLKDDEVSFVKSLEVLWKEVKPKLKGEQGLQGIQGNKGDQGLDGSQGDQGLRGPAGQNGQIKKEVIIGLSIGLGVVFCLFLAYVIVFHQKRIFSAFKSRKKSTKI